MNSLMQAAPDPEFAPARRYELSTGIVMAADDYGDPSRPPVLFLHGGGQTRHAWGGTAAAVAERGYYTVTADHRGHGDSSWDASGNYRVARFVEDTLALIEQLGRAPVVVGASLGGMAGLLATAAREDALRGLVLVDVTPRMEPAGTKRIGDFMKNGVEGFASLEEAADAVASYLPHRKRPNDLKGLRKNLRRGDDGRYRWHYDPAFLRAFDADKYDQTDHDDFNERMYAAARGLRVPTMLIRGRMSDVVSEETAREFLAAVPDAEYVDLEGASHMVAGDKNDIFTETVLSFLSRRFPTPIDD